MGTLIFLTRAELKVIAEVVCDPHSVEFIKALEENTEFEAIPLTSLTSEGFKEYMREDIPFVIETIHDSILKTYSRAFGLKLESALDVQDVLDSKSTVEGEYAQAIEFNSAYTTLCDVFNISEIDTVEETDMRILEILEHLNSQVEDALDVLSDLYIEDHDRFHEVIETKFNAVYMHDVVDDRVKQQLVDEHLSDDHECSPACLATFFAQRMGDLFGLEDNDD